MPQRNRVLQGEANNFVLKKVGSTMRLPILILHIIGGTLGMFSGFVAVFLRKGSRWHGLVGNVFVVSMLSMAAAGVYLATMKSQPGNILGGTITIYLVATAWATGRRRDNTAQKIGFADRLGLLVILAVAVTEVTFGLQAAYSPTGLRFDYPPGPYFFMGSVAVLATIGDVRLIVGGGISGAQRIARHLWRMCFALFIAAGSIFLARQHLFPAFMRKTGMLYFLSFLPLLLLVFWMIRIRFSGMYKRMASIMQGSQAATRTSMRMGEI
jgi:uncharacterized membrane protein